MAKRKIKEVVSIITEQPKTMWQKVKDWFYNSEAIFLAWVTSISGIVTGLIGYFDLGPIWSMLQTGTEFTRNQLIGMGVGIFGSGIAQYIARVRGTKDVAGRLLPTAEK